MMQYRARAFVWMAVGLVSVATLLIFWQANIISNPGAYSQSFEQIVSYFLLMLVLGSVLISHSEGEIAQIDIYKGELAKYLLRPISYLVIKFHGEIVWRIMSGIWALLIVIGLGFFGLRVQVTSDPQLFLLVVLSSVLGFLISYILTVILGLTAIWLTTTKGLFELYEMTILFLAGFMMPFSQIAGGRLQVLHYTPFASMVAVPVEILQGMVEVPEAIALIALQFFWVTVMYILYRVVWERGVRVFTGAGGV